MRNVFEIASQFTEQHYMATVFNCDNVLPNFARAGKISGWDNSVPEITTRKTVLPLGVGARATLG